MSNTLLIDLNRGVEIRKHRPTGMQIFMYRDDPGIYLNAFGKPVSEKLAKDCGFPVEELGRKRKAKEKLGAAMAAIESELAVNSEEKPVIAQRGGYTVRDVGLGRAIIEDDANGGTLTEQPMAQDYALKLLDELAPEPKGKTDTKSAKSDKDDSKQEKSDGKKA